MNAPFITTTVYKYRRYAPWILGAYCILLVTLFILSPYMSSVTVGILVGVLLLLPIYAAIQPKSIFAVRSVDERKLSMDAENIEWDGHTIPLKDVDDLNIYLFSFENFRHRELGVGFKTRTSEYGDQNKLNFEYRDKKYDFTFYLGDYTQYRTALQIISAWQKAGYDISARAAFDHNYIQAEMAYFTQRNI